jgi:hypothetical protein
MNFLITFWHIIKDKSRSNEFPKFIGRFYNHNDKITTCAKAEKTTNLDGFNIIYFNPACIFDIMKYFKRWEEKRFHGKVSQYSQTESLINRSL